MAGILCMDVIASGDKLFHRYSATKPQPHPHPPSHDFIKEHKINAMLTSSFLADLSTASGPFPPLPPVVLLVAVDLALLGLSC